MRHALRLWRRQPVLAGAAIVSLAIGIGANTAIFSVLNAVVLRPLPFPEADRLVVAWETSADNPARWVAPANFLDWRSEARSFVALAAFDDFAVNLTGVGEPERLRAAGASGTFFQALGVQAAVGRTLLPSDDAPGAPDVAVLTDGLARRLFGDSAAAIGRELILEGRAHTVAGVLPVSFSMPMAPDAEIWLGSDRGIPRSFPFPGDITAVRDSHVLYVVGRLADDVTPDMARQELASIMTRLERIYPDTNEGLGATVVPLHEQVVGEVRPLVVLLQLAVALMLAIGCANIASLILGQIAGRQAELAMRVALGASRGRLIRQLLAETLVIAVPGGVVGLLLAAWGLDALVALAPAELPRASEVALDRATLAFTLAITLLTALAFGIAPALSRSRASAADVEGQGRRVAGHRSVRRWHQLLAIGELALAQVLLVGAGLLLASFLAVQRVELGFVPDGRIAADLSLAPDRYARPRAGGSAGEFRVDIGPKRQLVGQVLTRLRNTPGVRAAAASFTAPMAGAPNRGIRIDGQPDRSVAAGPTAEFQVVTADYFRTLGITLVRGRAFTEEDRADRPPVVIVNQAFVDRYLTGRDAIGQVLTFGGDHRHQIVGVAANTRSRSVELPAEPTFYVPLEQNDERWPFLSFTVWYDDGSLDRAGTEGRSAGTEGRSAGASAPASPSTIASAIRAAVRQADPDQPIARIRTYDELLATALASRRFNTLIVGVFALTALLLAAVGTFGVMSFAVVSRTRELGVRAALGASPADLRRMVLGQGAWLSGVAVVSGLGAAWMATRWMASLLFEVQPQDPWTFGVVAAVLSSVALVATWLPARTATRVDPIGALRQE